MEKFITAQCGIVDAPIMGGLDDDLGSQIVSCYPIYPGVNSPNSAMKSWYKLV